MRHTMRWLRCLGAVLILAGLLVGVPWLLAATIGNPAAAWPDLIAGDISDRVVYSCSPRWPGWPGPNSGWRRSSSWRPGSAVPRCRAASPVSSDSSNCRPAH